jgi:hypothetical protein
MLLHHLGISAAVAGVFLGLMAAAALAGEWPPDYIRKPVKTADIGQVPILRILDTSGALRWQLPVVLWYHPNKELGGFLYPVGVSPDAPLSVNGGLMFVGYGLTRQSWDDYQGQRIDGGIAVMFTGTPQTSPSVDHSDTTDFETWTRLIQEKVENAKAHGAVAVWLERNPLAPPDAAQAHFHSKRTPSVWGGVVGMQLPLSVFGVGTDALGVVIGLSTDVYAGHAIPGDSALTNLLTTAEAECKGLGPIPLALSAELAWTGAQLHKREGTRCVIWYQPESPAARDIDTLAKAYDSTLGELESLLSARVEGRIMVLLFADWRSKLYCTHHLGWGAAQAGRVAVVYEGRGEERATLVHELCHIVAGGLGNPPACFGEGLGELAGNTLGNLQAVRDGRLAADDVTASNLRDGKLWTLPQLLALPEIGSGASKSPVAYPEAASFCAYLIRQIGFDGFRRLYQTLSRDDPGRITAELEKATGRTLAEIEADWHAYLLSLER